MKRILFICFLFSISLGYSNNDSLVIKPWDQMSFLPDSNNYNLFFGGPSSIYKSIFFDFDKLPIFSDHPFFGPEQQDVLNVKPKVPIVDAQYLLGAQLEQNLAIYHTQPISRKSNYSLSYLNRSHGGYFNNQLTNSNFLQANYFTSSKKEKYKLHSGLKYHRIYNRQNGGIKNDSNFTNSSDLFLNRLLIDVNMDFAYSNDKLMKIFVNQSFQLKSYTDSSFNNSNFLDLQLEFKRKSRNYYDSLSASHFLYNNYDSVVSNDTIEKNIFFSRLSYMNSFSRDSVQRTILIGLNSELIKHNNLLIDTLFNNYFFESKATLLSNKNSLSFLTEYYLSGFKKNNYKVELNASRKISNNINFKTHFSFNEHRPTYEIQQYLSNHLVWNNLFENMFAFSAFGKLEIGNVLFKVNYNDVKRPIYFDELSFPQQFSGTSQVIQTSLNYKINRKRIDILAEAIHQYQGGGQIFQLPEIIGQLKLNYKLVRKKSDFSLLLGLNGRYYSSFNLMNYSPTINNFTISNKRLQSSYFILDFIAKTKIQDVTLFAMVSHLNSGLMGYNYFTALNYPSPDRYIKFGIKWLFLN